MAEHIGVLAFQGGFREHAQTMVDLGARASLVRKPDELEGLDGLIVPGGESTTLDKLSRTFNFTVPLRDKIAAGFPVYGSCAGMVMLADTISDPQRTGAGITQESFGGIDMIVARNVFGRQIDSFEFPIRLSEITDPQSPFPAVFIRAPWAKSVGDGVEVLGRVPLPVAAGSDTAVVEEKEPVAVAVRQGKLLATAFHPELTTDRRVHRLFLDIIREEV